MTEVGLDSRRNGEERRRGRSSGRCARVRGRVRRRVRLLVDRRVASRRPRVDDWDFGLIDARAAAEAGARGGREAPSPRAAPARRDAPPRVSVVVCTYNGARTLEDCLEALLAASTIPTTRSSSSTTARPTAPPRSPASSGVRLIRPQNRGLSERAQPRHGGGDRRDRRLHRRRRVARTATGSRTWPASSRPRVTPAVGGPNIPPPEDGLVAACVADAPGGPMHVLLSRHARPSTSPAATWPSARRRCRRSAASTRSFRSAGDDVDVCWRLQDAGRPSASARAPWSGTTAAVLVAPTSAAVRLRQGRGPARAEVAETLQRPGHLTWAGYVYGNRLSTALSRRRGRIRYGTWGRGLFQSVYQPAPGLVSSLPLTPEWLLLIGLLAGMSSLGLLWPPLLLGLPLFALASGAMLLEAGLAARKRPSRRSRARCPRRFGAGGSGLLHLLQPLVRL